MSDSQTEIGWEHRGIGSVLNQNQLAVPANQREYAWETREVRTLFHDFARAINEGARSYFLGTIVTIARPTNILEVVDGQQRLATTAILLCAIRDYLQPTEPDLAGSIDTEFLTVFNRSTRTRVPRLRLNIDDNDYFWARLRSEGPTPEATKPSHRLLADAFAEAARQTKIIVGQFDAKDHGNVLNRWVDFIGARASVILLRVPNAANAYRMFETLNDRGKRTSQSDLVKNYLFGYAGDRLPEVQQRWAFMRGALETMEDDDITITFLRHALTAIRGFVREAEVFEAVQSHAIGEQPVVTFSGQLESLANTFVATHNQEHERWNSYSTGTRRALEVLNLFNMSFMRPLILAIAERFSEKEAGKALTFCVSLGVRLMLTGRIRTGTVEEGLAEAAHKVFDASVKDANELISHLKPLTPPDTQFRAAFETATVSNRKLARYFLRSLEMTAKGEGEPWHIPNDDRDVINLEHVLPDKPGENWPQFTEDEVKLYKKRLGNLVLLRASENSEMQSDSFSHKREVYANCPYVLTSQVAEVSNWRPSEIIERQKVLAGFALKTWPT